MWFNNRSDPNMLKAGVTDWQKALPAKPRSENVANAAGERCKLKPASRSKIAPLLPLNGQAAVFSRAIQQVFETAKTAPPPSA